MLEHDLRIIGDMKERVASPYCSVNLPPLSSSAWSRARAPVDEIRHGLEVQGRNEVRHAFGRAFFKAHGGLSDGCKAGLYGTMENCGLSEHVIGPLMRKIGSSELRPNLPANYAVASTFYVLMGALAEDPDGLAMLQEFIIDLFLPLIEVGMQTYDEHGPSKKAKVSGGDSRQLTLLQNIYAYESAIGKVQAGPSSPSVDVDHTVEEEQTRVDTEYESQPSSVPPLNNSAVSGSFQPVFHSARTPTSTVRTPRVNRDVTPRQPPDLVFTPIEFTPVSGSRSSLPDIEFTPRSESVVSGMSSMSFGYNYASPRAPRRGRQVVLSPLEFTPIAASEIDSDSEAAPLPEMEFTPCSVSTVSDVSSADFFFSFGWPWSGVLW
ncbi:hypothetical protein FB45DRAFT_945798 [Roridomyces roridus]|uniref:Uncharacterized protein n=1 Tax=Roridomyces roridus TaxID=1738132 RepID=A0AAD7FAF5_9AGAR|nr:hypothetical protein FB45DRAFT_945798 [Roridomyces roridus]